MYICKCLKHVCLRFILFPAKRLNILFGVSFSITLAREVSHGDMRLVGGGQVVGIRIYRQVALRPLPLCDIDINKRALTARTVLNCF